MRALSVMIVACTLLTLAGCSSLVHDSALHTYDQSGLPPADLDLSIPGLGPCTNSPERSLRLNSQQPVTILVHGCRGSTGNFRALAQVMAFHGQQAACFTYDDRDSLMRSSAQLAVALDALEAKMRNKQVTVIGHSQGALVTRKALVSRRPDPMQNRDVQIRLVTVSGPFSGIASAEQCGTPAAYMRVLTLGLLKPLCWIVSGDKWYEITSASEFIRQPGELLPQVHSHLKIVTDERNTCRRSEDGTCVETDYAFSLEEQYFTPVDKPAIVKNVEIKAGHVEIVGDQVVAPRKLISVLQQYGILNQTDILRSAEFDRLLATLYPGNIQRNSP